MAAEMTPERWEATQRYLEEWFAAEPPGFAALARDAEAAGFPSISVGPSVGRLLALLAGLLRDGAGAARIVEVGMLGGYSAAWLARGLAPEGRLVTIEPEPERVAFARERFASMGETRIEVREGLGIPVLEELAREWGPDSVDVVFLDGIKSEYPDYLERARPLLRPGGLLLADNALGSSDFWIDEPPGSSERRDTVHRFNTIVSADPGFEAMPVPIRQGLLVARFLGDR